MRRLFSDGYSDFLHQDGSTAGPVDDPAITQLWSDSSTVGNGTTPVTHPIGNSDRTLTAPTSRFVPRQEISATPTSASMPASQTYPPSATPNSSSSPTATGTASTSPFVINIIWDTSVNSAPSGFVAGVEAAVQYLESQFADPVTINLHVGYGEVNGTALGGSYIGQSWSNLISLSYTQLVSALKTDAKTNADVTAVTSLPTTSPINGTYWTTYAEAKALGLLPATSSSVDGYVGFSSTASFTYNDSNGVAAGTYDFNGIVLHEITEVMGRMMLTGGTIGSTTNSYYPLDLFHYSSPGVRDFVQSTPGYFSIDGGNTDLGAFNTASGFDPGDWASSVKNDAFDAFLTSGVVNSVSNADLTELDVLGWDPAGASPVCYARGTMCRTPDGELAVERLRPGEQVMTLVDGEPVARSVKWLGHRRIDLTNHDRPETVAPIRIQRGAFDNDMPHRDLVVSPDHAIFVDGKLICARQLVNSTTIRQETGWTAVDYYHVELDQHAILLAEGLPAESYIDTGNRGFFANSGAPLVLHPDLTDESGYPTREAGSCAPFVWDEASVRPVWQRLAERAASVGQPVPQRATTTDAGLRLLFKGRSVKPAYGDGNRVIFTLPRGAREVRLVSRAASPTDARPWLEDRRRLGVRVARIVLRGTDEVREVPVDHPDLASGWWAVERHGQTISRWTDGEAVLPLPAVHGDAMLEIHLAGAMTYLVSTEARDEVARRVA
jgi:hypothetical protein